MISGYAYTPNYEKIQKRYTDRYNELREIASTMVIDRRRSYAKFYFSGKLETPEQKALTELDLCLIADHGNLCFGGECRVCGDTFNGVIYTD